MLTFRKEEGESLPLDAYYLSDVLTVDYYLTGVTIFYRSLSHLDESSLSSEWSFYDAGW